MIKKFSKKVHAEIKAAFHYYFAFMLILLLLLVFSVLKIHGYIPFRILPCLIREIARLDYIKGECLLKFIPGISAQEKKMLFQRYGLIPIQQSPYGGFERVAFNINFPVMEMVYLLKNEPILLYAEPNYLAKAHIIPNDPLFRYQWNMLQINADLAWNITNGIGTTIAVLDSGIAYENFDIYAQAPDLAGTLFVPGWDFVNSDANPDDDYGHGTHVSGTIAQTTNNALGCAGVAFGASVMPVKVLDNTGYGSLINVVDGIYYAANNAAKIINMSFGFGNSPSLTLQSAVQYADSSGSVMVCSAGNEGVSLPNYPASYPACICVSATRYDLTQPSYSNYGLDIDLCAPGGDLTVDQNTDGYPDGILQQSHDGVNFLVFDYYSGEGTSWSAAHVSAVAAMVTSVGGITMTPLEIKGILESTATDIGTLGWDEYFGWGVINAAAALSAVQQGATVLSATPLIPFSPLPIIPVTSPTASVAGFTAPLAPLWSNQSPVSWPIRYSSSIQQNIPKLLPPWHTPIILNNPFQDLIPSYRIPFNTFFNPPLFPSFENPPGFLFPFAPTFGINVSFMREAQAFPPPYNPIIPFFMPF